VELCSGVTEGVLDFVDGKLKVGSN
jgi:hypothetical protein